MLTILKTLLTPSATAVVDKHVAKDAALGAKRIALRENTHAKLGNIAQAHSDRSNKLYDAAANISERAADAAAKSAKAEALQRTI